jgi:hypothetical protein
MAPTGDEQAKSVEQKIAELQQQLSEAQSKLRERSEPAETSVPNREIEEVRTASMKLPAFWRRDPKLWFSQIEAQFHSHLVRSDTSKYYAVIAALDCSTLQPVSNIIANPPATGKYDAVKKTLIDSYSDSREQQIRKLLKELDLGDRKPSELLREMKTLASDHVDDQMLQTLWLHRLPLNVQLLVSASDGVPLEKMASIADKLVEIVSNRGSPSIAAIANEPAPPAVAPQTTIAETLKSLQEQITALTTTVKQLANRGRYHSQQRQRSQSRNRNDNNEADKQNQVDNDICFYYRRHGNQARRCTTPCKFVPSSGN